MIFDELDRSMRIYETSHDHCVLPGLWMVARLDGRGFTRLVREQIELAAPFDERFHVWMQETTRHLMNCGFQVLYGYTQSDEISLLLARDETQFGRKLRKYHSILAAEASVCFSRQANHHAIFDARISQLPDAATVVDYFRWRNEDAARNALNAWCYWTLRKQGETPAKATLQLSGLSPAAKNELLFQQGINFNDLPLWQKRGSGLYWSQREHTGYNPRSGESTVTTRRELILNAELPMKDDYSHFIRNLLGSSASEAPPGM